MTNDEVATLLQNILPTKNLPKEIHKAIINNLLLTGIKTVFAGGMILGEVTRYFNASKQAGGFIKNILSEMTIRNRQYGVFGNNMVSYGVSSEAAQTERQRAISAIQNAHLNARYYIGQEARLRYQSEGY